MLPCHVVQITALLPKLEQADYFMSPSSTQLAAMARMDPQSLAKVANFTIGKHRAGQIRWIDPVDVRELDIDSTVRLSKDTVEVSNMGQASCMGVCSAQGGNGFLPPAWDGLCQLGIA